MCNANAHIAWRSGIVGKNKGITDRTSRVARIITNIGCAERRIVASASARRKTVIIVRGEYDVRAQAPSNKRVNWHFHAK